MLCRRIDCVQNLSFSMRGLNHEEIADTTYQGCWACVNELVLSARRDNHEISSFYVLVLAIDRCFRNSRGECQCLVYCMNLS